jgi:Spy/CpxP family protein refolding chaperone
MRKACGAVLMAGVLAWVAGSVQAQRPGGGGFGFGGFGAGLLLRNASVQKELKLTDAQKEKLTAALDKVRDKYKDDIAKFRDLSEEERRDLGKKMSEDTNKAVAGILDAKQRKRFKQIELQQGGIMAFANPEVQKELKLTDEQKKQLREIAEEQGKKMRELFQGGFNEETRKKMAELRKETQEKTDKVLTAEQKKTWKEMTGEPFQVQFERPGGGRPRPEKK